MPSWGVAPASSRLRPTLQLRPGGAASCCDVNFRLGLPSWQLQLQLQEPPWGTDVLQGSARVKAARLAGGSPTNESNQVEQVPRVPVPVARRSEGRLRSLLHLFVYVSRYHARPTICPSVLWATNCLAAYPMVALCRPLRCPKSMSRWLRMTHEDAQ